MAGSSDPYTLHLPQSAVISKKFRATSVLFLRCLRLIYLTSKPVRLVGISCRREVNELTLVVAHLSWNWGIELDWNRASNFLGLLRHRRD